LAHRRRRTGNFSLAVLGSSLPVNTSLIDAVHRSKVPLISELELGLQLSQCLSIAIAGTRGKATTAELVERMLVNNHRKAVLSGHRARPVCSVIEKTKELDYLILQIDSFQLEMAEGLRPSVAVLTSLAPDHLDHFISAEEYARAHARLFRNQQSLDWSIVQSEALARLRALNLPVPARTITFSADDRNADLCLDRGQLVSRIPDWSKRLLDMEHCQLRGPHNAENFMAALAVGYALRIPLEGMMAPLKTHSAGAHRLELVAEINGVQYINDSKATSVDALRNAIRATRPGNGGRAQHLAYCRGVRTRVWISMDVVQTAFAARQASVSIGRIQHFYSLHRRGFVGRSSGRSGEKCDFRRRSFACTGSFELGSVSKPSTSR
jgi:UDP-N-acetylmuramoylalanine--D-glutamate ligase